MVRAVVENVTPIGSGKKPARKAPAKRPTKELVIPAQLGSVEHELKQRGLTWQETADIIGHGDASRAYAEHERFMQLAVMEMEAAERRRALQMEVGRLDRLQADYWPKAREGDLFAAKFVLDCIQARVKLMRLDQPEASEVSRTVVMVEGDGPQYVAQLKRLIGEQGVVDVEVDDEDDGPPLG